MTLYIDSKEPKTMQAKVEATIKDRDTGENTEVKQLKTGDFVYKNTVIERKEASDLASSIKDRRLKQQTRRMLKDFDNQYIILEGDPFDLTYASLHDNAFIGSLVSRSEAGVNIIYTPNKDGTAYAVNKIVSKHLEEDEHRTVELNETQVKDADTEVAMLCQIEGLTREKAEKIHGMTSFREIIEEPEKVKDKVQVIDGVGKVTAKKIIEAVKP